MNEVKLIRDDQLARLMQVKGAKELQARYMAMRQKKGMKGDGWKDDVSSWFVKTGQDVDKFLKKTKVISKAGKLAKYVLPFVGQAEAIPVVETAAAAADALGYGNKVGCGFLSQVGTGPVTQGDNIIETNIETTTTNGTLQDVTVPIFTQPGQGFVGPYSTIAQTNKPYAGPPGNGIAIGPLSMDMQGGGVANKLGCGVGAMNVISNSSRVAL